MKIGDPYPPNWKVSCCETPEPRVIELYYHDEDVCRWECANCHAHWATRTPPDA